MKRNLPSESSDRFKGSVRHYHRADTRAKRTWDDWVDGGQVAKRRSKNWLKILAVACGTIALVGIVMGLVIELS